MTEFSIEENLLIDRPVYLEQLVTRMHNGMIKVVTGLRRCGKSYLLFNLFIGFFSIPV